MWLMPGVVPGRAMVIASYRRLAGSWLSSSLTTAVVTAASTPVATASASRRYWRRARIWMASATGRMYRAISASGRANVSSAAGICLVAPTRSDWTAAVVALAAMPAPASATISMQDSVQRSPSTGLRMRRSSRSSTSISPGCGDVTGRSCHLGA